MQIILPKTKTVKIERTDTKVTLYDLPVWYIDKAREDPEEDTPQNALMAASSLSEGEIEALGYSELLQLYQEIVTLTFGDTPTSKEGDDGGKP